MKRSLVRVEQQIEDANTEKNRMLKAIRKGIASEDEFRADLDEVRHTINSLMMKAASIREDIKTSVSDKTQERIAEQMASDFAHFSTDPFERQAMLLKKYIRKMTACKNDVTDNVTLHFDVKPGMPELLYQLDSFSKDAPKKPPKPPFWQGSGCTNPGEARRHNWRRSRPS